VSFLAIPFSRPFKDNAPNPPSALILETAAAFFYNALPLLLFSTSSTPNSSSPFFSYRQALLGEGQPIRRSLPVSGAFLTKAFPSQFVFYLVEGTSLFFLEIPSMDRLLQSAFPSIQAIAVLAGIFPFSSCSQVGTAHFFFPPSGERAPGSLLSRSRILTKPVSLQLVFFFFNPSPLSPLP